MILVYLEQSITRLLITLILGLPAEWTFVNSARICISKHVLPDGPTRKLLGSHGLVEPGQIRGAGKHWAEEAIAWQVFSGSQKLA